MKMNKRTNILAGTFVGITVISLFVWMLYSLSVTSDFTGKSWWIIVGAMLVRVVLGIGLAEFLTHSIKWATKCPTSKDVPND